jgi:hypothetical protein
MQDAHQVVRRVPEVVFQTTILEILTSKAARSREAIMPGNPAFA